MGSGLAEDPGLRESFGQNRCRLVADAVIRAYEQGKKSLDERLQVVADRFAEANINLTEPFLSPGSKDDYPFSSNLHTDWKLCERQEVHLIQTTAQEPFLGHR